MLKKPVQRRCEGPLCNPLWEGAMAHDGGCYFLTVTEGKDVTDYGWKYFSGEGLHCPRCIKQRILNEAFDTTKPGFLKARGGEYIFAKRGGSIVLDGTFSPEELRAIAWWMEGGRW